MWSEVKSDSKDGNISMVLCQDKAVGQCKNSVPSSHQVNIIYAYPLFHSGLTMLLYCPVLHPIYYFRLSTVADEIDVHVNSCHTAFCVQTCMPGLHLFLEENETSNLIMASQDSMILATLISTP